jgi:hypothetical protein
MLSRWRMQLLRLLMSYNMNTKQFYSIVSSAAFVVALLFFAIYNQLILFRSPWNARDIITSSSAIQKKQVMHYYYHGDKWKTEKQELLWSDSIENNIIQLLNAWFMLLDEEHITPKKTMVQSALVSTADCLYISFDHNVFVKEDPIFKKWMLIEGLLKTLAVNGIACKQVQFFVQHQQLHDSHLDFSFAWPINGFFKI